MKRARALLILSLLALSLHAQTTPPARATIAGKVTKDPSGEAVKKVVIELIGENPKETGNYTTITGQDGDFRIENIVPGRYLLFVERTGFLETNKRHKAAGARWLALAAGQEINDLLIAMQASVAITGRVSDEDGDPMVNAQVVVWHQRFNSAHSHWEQDGGAVTDDLGNYRVANLRAGNYFVSVTPPASTRNMIESSSKNASAAADEAHAAKPPEPTYATTYYPNARERGQASAVQVRPGDEMPVNFALTPTPSLVVRGVVANLATGSSATVFLLPPDGTGSMTGADVRKDGSFEIRGVPSGSFTLAAVAQNGDVVMRASQKLEVGAADVSGLRLVPQVGAWIRGRVRVEGKSGAAAAGAGQMMVTLRPADGDEAGEAVTMFGPSRSSTRVAADGSFEWKDVVASRYTVDVEGADSPEWFVKSVSSGGRDATDGAFSVSGGALVLDVVISANAASVTGVVTSAKNEVVANASVVAVPEQRLRKDTDQFHKVDTDQTGRFTMRGLKPGSYTIFAWESVDGGSYYDPDFLKTYEGQGQVVRLKEGEHSSLQLTVIPDSDAEQ